MELHTHHKFGEGGEMELLCESTEIWARHINGLHEPVQPISNWANFITRRRRTRRLFCFCIFQKKFLQKYIFGFRFYSSIPLPPGRGAAGGR